MALSITMNQTLLSQRLARGLFLCLWTFLFFSNTCTSITKRHLVQQCPHDELRWKIRVLEKMCKEFQKYHCMPLHQSNSFIEFCELPRTFNLEIDGCPYIEKIHDSSWSFRPCQNLQSFTSQRISFSTNEFYKFNECYGEVETLSSASDFDHIQYRRSQMVTEVRNTSKQFIVNISSPDTNELRPYTNQVYLSNMVTEKVEEFQTIDPNDIFLIVLGAVFFIIFSLILSAILLYKRAKKMQMQSKESGIEEIEMDSVYDEIYQSRDVRS